MTRRRVVALIGAVLAALFVLRSALPTQLRPQHIDLALRISPNDSAALADRAAELVTPDASAADLEDASALATRALQVDPIVPVAARTLGLVAELRQEPDRARRYFDEAFMMSRRDIATLLWLIEDSVRRDDAAGALRYYDIALRVSDDLRDTLFPILVAATDDPALIGPISETLRKDGDWPLAFTFFLVERGKNIRHMAELLRRLPPDRFDVPAAVFAVRAVEAGDVASAWMVYRTMAPAESKSLLRDGTFASRGAAGFPFRWQYLSQPDYWAEPDTAGLSFAGRAGNTPVVARQLLTLRPGRYRLESVGTLSAEAGGGAAWIVSCATGAALARVPLASSAARTRSSGDVVVPALGCPAQWLTLAVSAGDQPEGSAGTVERVQITSSRVPAA